MMLNRCECSDRGCRVHQGVSTCRNEGTERLYRVDIEDRTGTGMCQACAGDATDCGLFTDMPGDDDADEA